MGADLRGQEDNPRMTDDPTPTPAIDHYPNGNVRFTGSHLDGEMHGAWVFYRSDGTVMRFGSFDRGRQVGTWTTLARDGSVVKVTTFAGSAG
jgi:antitoxin component YwqK of YwqJK toxin-antitoxin module